MKNFKYILVDGTAFLFRAYFANLRQNLTAPDGFPTGAMFGVISSIKKLEKSYPDSQIILIFDAKGKNFRHQIYPKYKAHRKEAEEDLIMQIEPLYEIVCNMGYHFLCVDNVEADDTIATICKLTSDNNIKTLIASGDKDLLQLVGENTYQLDMKGNLLDYAGVIEKVGVRPEQIMDFLALTGDSADNIPGVPSVGPKTAAKWLGEYQTLANLKQNANNIGGKVGEKLRENFASLDLSHKLVELKFDVKLPCDVFAAPPVANPIKLKQLFVKYGFKAWLKDLDTTPALNTNLLDKYNQNIIFDLNQFDNLLNQLNNCQYFVLDLETTGLDYMVDSIVGLVFLIDNNSYYLPIAHSYLGVPDQLDGKMVLDTLQPILENPKIGKIGQNLKYDSHILKNHNINLAGIIHDTMLMSFCLNSTATKHNMDDLAQFYLNHKTTHFKEIAGVGKKQLSFDEIDINIAAPYALEDVIITYELFLILSEKIMQIPSVYKLYSQLELPLIPVMVAIERNGVQLDENKLFTQHQEITNKINTLTTDIYQMAKVEFNLDSPKQLKEVLFSENGLHLESKKKTASGELSTNEETLKSLEHPIAKLLLEYRMLNKLNTTYLQALPKNISAKTNRLHTSYHQSGTLTGRLSSSNPNLQNIPIRTPEGAKIRESFIADKGNKIIALDYSQIELRIIAHLSEDENLISAFNSGADIHKSTASLMFGVDLHTVDDNMRRSAKAINFGLMYGMGPNKLAKQIDVSPKIAKEYIANYFASYPKVQEYITNTQESAKEKGFVETILGRRIYLKDINSKSRVASEHAKRMAINAPMQGSSADIIKQAMLEIYNSNINAKMLMQVHDELVFEVAESQAENIAKKLQNIMQSVVELKVPLIVDYGIADNWGDAH
jgi:DNA polymerase-1